MTLTIPVNLSPAIIGGILLPVLVIGVFAVRELFHGYEVQRALHSRTALDEAERRAHSLPARMDSRIRGTRLGRAVESRIVASGVKVRVSTLIIAITVSGLAAIYVIGVVLAPLFGVVAAVGVGWAFFKYLRTREEKRREQFIAQLPELARVLSNATSSGLALRTAIEMAADEMEDPAGAELRRTAESLKLGQPIEAALSDLGERLPSRELSVLVSTLLVSSRAGGSLISSLRNIAATLDDRKELRREVKTQFAQSVYSGYLVAILGVGALFLMNAIQPGIIEEMTQSVLGLALLAISGGLFAFGLVLVNRVTRVDI